MSSSSTSDAPEQIDLNKVPIGQLAQIKQDVEKEVSSIQESLQTLYGCKAKYASSKEALESFQPDWQNRQILVPLTSSMYVPGRMKNENSLVIDVGTGYYVEKDLESSKDYFKRRVEYVQEQIEKIEKIQLSKSRFLGVISHAFEMKQAMALKQQQQQQQTA